MNLKYRDNQAELYECLQTRIFSQHPGIEKMLVKMYNKSSSKQAIMLYVTLHRRKQKVDLLLYKFKLSNNKNVYKPVDTNKFIKARIVKMLSDITTMNYESYARVDRISIGVKNEVYSIFSGNVVNSFHDDVKSALVNKKKEKDYTIRKSQINVNYICLDTTIFVYYIQDYGERFTSYQRADDPACLIGVTAMLMAVPMLVCSPILAVNYIKDRLRKSSENCKADIEELQVLSNLQENHELNPDDGAIFREARARFYKNANEIN